MHGVIRNTRITLRVPERLWNITTDELFGDSARAKNSLKRGNVNNLYELIEHINRDSLKNIRNMGAITVKEIKERVFNFVIEEMTPEEVNKFVKEYVYGREILG